CYYIDGRLAAVGVLDVLHTCVSSVYLFYDPDFRELSLGTFSALHEIALVRTLRRQVSRQIEYYYMGYFIPSCPKMAYKAQWRPAELLDMVTLGWVPIDRCLERIREHPAFCTFDPRIDSRNLVRDCPQDVLDHAPVLDPATLGEREREAAMHLEFCIGLDALARVPATRLVGLSADLERAVLQTCASLGLGLARRMELCL
ncbi:Arginyl-tRNA--protein transferase 1, partial [Coemansia nantahalensis]